MYKYMNSVKEATLCFKILLRLFINTSILTARVSAQVHASKKLHRQIEPFTLPVGKVQGREKYITVHAICIHF